MNTAPHHGRSRPVASGIEHVDRISTQTTIFVLITVALIAYEIQWILLPFVIAGAIAYICTPAMAWVSARSRLPRWVVVVLAFLILLGASGLVGLLDVPPLLRTLGRIATEFQALIESLVGGLIGNQPVSILGQTMNAAQLAQTIVDAVRDWIGHGGTLFVMGGVAFGAFFGIFLTLVLLFYFLLSGPHIMKGMLWLVPPRQRPLIELIWSRLDPILKRYFIGVFAVAVYAITVSYIGLGLILGLPHAGLLALITGLLEMIPVIGPITAIAIVGLEAVQHAKGIGPIVAFAVYVTVLRLSIDQLFGPLLLGSSARLHPTLIMFCFLSGSLLFGVVGAILAVPVALTIRVTLSILYEFDDGGITPHKAQPG